jgi:transcription antitermination factor NusA-like protein
MNSARIRVAPATQVLLIGREGKNTSLCGRILVIAVKVKRVNDFVAVQRVAVQLFTWLAVKDRFLAQTLVGCEGEPTSARDAMQS